VYDGRMSEERVKYLLNKQEIKAVSSVEFDETYKQLKVGDELMLVYSGSVNYGNSICLGYWIIKSECNYPTYEFLERCCKQIEGISIEIPTQLVHFRDNKVFNYLEADHGDFLLFGFAMPTADWIEEETFIHMSPPE